MSNEEAILKRLESIESQLGGLVESADDVKELKDELSPIANHAFRILIHELGEVESGFQLEDSFELIKQSLRSIKNLTYVLEQMENMIDLWTTVEPLLQTAVPKVIAHLDKWEQQGVFSTYSAMIDVRSKVAQAYGPERISEMGDGFVFLVGLLEKLGDPQIRETMEGMVDLLGSLDVNQAKDTGPFGMLSAMGNPEAKKGLGVMIELTKGLGKLKK